MGRERPPSGAANLTPAPAEGVVHARLPVAVFPSKERARGAGVQHGADLVSALIHESQTSSDACEILPGNGVRIDRARIYPASLPPTAADLASAVFRSRVSLVRPDLSGLRDRRHSRRGHHDA